MSACLQQKWHDETAEECSVLTAFAWKSRGSTDVSSHQDVGLAEFRFGNWCLVPGARLLLHDGRPVELGSRAFDLLHLLSSMRGTVVEKSAIVSFVWPNTIVEESNLRFQMAALRKALGRDGALIKTIPGRGYILAQEYSTAATASDSADSRRLPPRTPLQAVGGSSK